MKLANDVDILRASRRVIRKMIKDKKLIKSETSAGFRNLKDGNGLQIFVTAYRYSEELFEKDPETGGLLTNRR